MLAFVRAVGGSRRGGFRDRAGKEPRGAIVFCVMYNSPSSLGSRVGNSGPSCPLYLLQWLVERYIRPLTVTTSWRPSFRSLVFLLAVSLRHLPRSFVLSFFYSFSSLPPPSLSCHFLVSFAALSFSRVLPFPCSQAASLAGYTHSFSFQSHPFFTLFSFGQFCVSESPLFRGEGIRGVVARGRRTAEGRHVSERSNNVT